MNILTIHVLIQSGRDNNYIFLIHFTSHTWTTKKRWKVKGRRTEVTVTYATAHTTITFCETEHSNFRHNNTSSLSLDTMIYKWIWFFFLNTSINVSTRGQFLTNAPLPTTYIISESLGPQYKTRICTTGCNITRLWQSDLYHTKLMFAILGTSG